jgi:hypothetical protein
MAAINRGCRKYFSNTASLSTNIFPVDEPKKYFNSCNIFLVGFEPLPNYH